MPGCQAAIPPGRASTSAPIVAGLFARARVSCAGCHLHLHSGIAELTRAVRGVKIRAGMAAEYS
jgi:hypothetical protein